MVIWAAKATSVAASVALDQHLLLVSMMMAPTTATWTDLLQRVVV